MGISEATFYNWKKQYAGMGITELAELRQLREENSKLKRLVAVYLSTSTYCRRSSQKSCKASSPTTTDTMGARGLSDE
jgi:putative transposase